MRIFDLHNDFLTENFSYYKNITKNVKVNCAVYKGNLTFKKSVELANKFNKLNLKNAYLSFEDISYKDLDLTILKSLNPICVSLTYNGENEYGFGVNEDKPLKLAGVNLIKKLNDANICIDTSHLSNKGILDACYYAKHLLNTHSNLDFCFKHKRNLTFEGVSEIVRRNGIIGITFVGYFLSQKTAKISDVVNQISCFCDYFGCENIAIGTDFNGTDYLPKNLNFYYDFQFLKYMLEKAGFTSVEIDKIFYKNAENFFKRNKIIP